MFLLLLQTQYLVTLNVVCAHGSRKTPMTHSTGLERMAEHSPITQALLMIIQLPKVSKHFQITLLRVLGVVVSKLLLCFYPCVCIYVDRLAKESLSKDSCH